MAVTVLADYFGMKSFGKILGLSSILLLLTFFGSIFIGIGYDEFATYTLAILAGLTLTAGLCYLAASPPEWRGPGAAEATPAVL